MRTVNQIFELDPVRHKDKFKTDELISWDVAVGVEIEVENVTFQVPGKVWKYWEDREENSLRNDRGRSWEFVTKHPTYGKRAIEAFELIDKVFNRDNSPDDFRISRRTGLHVHIDVGDMTPIQVRDMVLYYLMHEAVIMDSLDKDRQDNIFAVPLAECSADITRIACIQTESGLISVARSFGKYSAINLASIAVHGTLEFRAQKATFNKQKLINWVNTFIAFKKAAMTKPFTLDDPSAFTPELWNIYRNRNTFQLLAQGRRAAYKLLNAAKLDKENAIKITNLFAGE